MSKVVQLPNTKDFQFGGLDLKLRLDGKAIVNIEKRLDESMMGLFVNGQGGFKIPATNKLLIVLQGANQTSGVNDQAIVDAFEKFLEEGNTTMELFTTIQELLEDSGFFGKKKAEKQEVETASLDTTLTDETIL